MDSIARALGRLVRLGIRFLDKAEKWSGFQKVAVMLLSIFAVGITLIYIIGPDPETDAEPVPLTYEQCMEKYIQPLAEEADSLVERQEMWERFYLQGDIDEVTLSEATAATMRLFEEHKKAKNEGYEAFFDCIP